MWFRSVVVVVVFVQWQQAKNVKEDREDTEGKSGRVQRGEGHQNWQENGHHDHIPFNLKGKLSPGSYPIQFERK